MVFGHARQGVDWLKEELQRIAALKAMREGIKPSPAVQVQPAPEEPQGQGLDVVSGIGGMLGTAAASFIPGAGPIVAPLVGTAVQQGIKTLGGEGSRDEAIKGFGGAVGAGTQRAAGAWAKSQQQELQAQERLAERKALFNRMEQYRSPLDAITDTAVGYRGTVPSVAQPTHPIAEGMFMGATPKIQYDNPLDALEKVPPMLQPTHPTLQNPLDALQDAPEGTGGGTGSQEFKGPKGEGMFPYDKIPTNTEDRVEEEKKSGFYDERGVMLPGSPILHRRTSGRTAEAMSAKPGLVSQVRAAANSFSPQYGPAQGPEPQGMPNQTIAQMESALASGDVPLHQIEEMTRLLRQLKSQYGGVA